jgi:hypothetical protein
VHQTESKKNSLLRKKQALFVGYLMFNAIKTWKQLHDTKEREKFTWRTFLAQRVHDVLPRR